MAVLAATAWESNASMIESCVALGYLKDSDAVLDPTYGQGKWWAKWKPEALTCSDLTTGTDFRQLPHPDSVFDAAVFDPPYVCTGNRAKTTIPDFYARYGLTECPTTPQALQDMIDAGLKELLRVVKPRGLVLAKCADYVSSGKLWLGTHRTLQHALDVGYFCQDRLIYVGHARPQPPRTRTDGETVRQEHARTNWSMLLVLRTPR